MKEIEIISRSIIKAENRILLCKNLKGNYYYLPGGHIEHKENAENALKRELIEETGEKFENFSFIGVLENFYKVNKEIVHEINLVFLVELKDIKKIKSKEGHISFEWFEINKLSKIKLLPKSVIYFIKNKKIKYILEKYNRIIKIV